MSMLSSDDVSSHCSCITVLVCQNSNVVTTLKNQIAELEEEKGNLQLQLLDTDETKTGQH